MPTNPSLPITLFFVYSLFLAGCFTAFLLTPYLIIRYINLKNINNSKCKYLSKPKVWLISIVCSPLTVCLVMFLCEFFGDSYFLGFFMLLGVLALSPFLAYFLLPKVKKLEEEFEQNISN